MTYRTLCPEKKVLDTTFRGFGKQCGFTLIAYALVALAVLGTLSGIAYKIRESGKDSVRAEWNEAIATQREEEIQRSINAAFGLREDRAKRRTIIQERTIYVDRNIEKLVTVDSCIKPSGVSCINAAINGQDAAGCKPDGTVPAPKPAV